MSETSVAQERRRERMARERGEEIEHVEGRIWVVPSCSGGGAYLVDLGAETCACPDFEHRGENCKHILAAAIASAKSTGCAGCGRKARRSELLRVGPGNLAFFEGAALCSPCAVSHGIA